MKGKTWYDPPRITAHLFAEKTLGEGFQCGLRVLAPTPILKRLYQRWCLYGSLFFTPMSTFP